MELGIWEVYFFWNKTKLQLNDQIAVLEIRTLRDFAKNIVQFEIMFICVFIYFEWLNDLIRFEWLSYRDKSTSCQSRIASNATKMFAAIKVSKNLMDDRTEKRVT